MHTKNDSHENALKKNSIIKIKFIFFRLLKKIKKMQ